MRRDGWERWERPISFLSAVAWMWCELWLWGGRPIPLLAITGILTGKEGLRLYMATRAQPADGGRPQ